MDVRPSLLRQASMPPYSINRATAERTALGPNPVKNKSHSTSPPAAAAAHGGAVLCAGSIQRAGCGRKMRPDTTSTCREPGRPREHFIQLAAQCAFVPKGGARATLPTCWPNRRVSALHSSSAAAAQRRQGAPGAPPRPPAAPRRPGIRRLPYVRGHNLCFPGWKIPAVP